MEAELIAAITARSIEKRAGEKVAVIDLTACGESAACAQRLQVESKARTVVLIRLVAAITKIAVIAERFDDPRIRTIEARADLPRERDQWGRLLDGVARSLMQAAPPRLPEPSPVPAPSDPLPKPTPNERDHAGAPESPLLPEERRVESTGPKGSSEINLAPAEPPPAAVARREPGEPPPPLISATAADRAPPTPYGAYLTLGSGAVLLGTAAVLYLSAFNSMDSLEQSTQVDCPADQTGGPCLIRTITYEEAASEVDSIRIRQGIAYTGGAVGAAAIGIGLLWLLTGGDDEPVDTTIVSSSDNGGWSVAYRSRW